MKATTISYARLNNLGNYENERIELTVELADGDSAQAALIRAKAFVERNSHNREREAELQRARRISANPENYSYREVKEAQDLLALAESQQEPAEQAPF